MLARSSMMRARAAAAAARPVSFKRDARRAFSPTATTILNQGAQAQQQKAAPEAGQEVFQAHFETVKSSFDPVVRETKEKIDWTSPETYAAVTRPPHQAYTLSPETYESEEFYEVEKERVWGKSWVCIGLADQIRQAGDTITAELAGQPIFAVRDKSGKLNGFRNVCRHRGSKLVRKDGRYPVISCPYHRWGYALDGRLLATPMWDTVEGGDRYDAKTGTFKESKNKTKAKKKQAAVGASGLTDEEAAAEVAEAEQRVIASAAAAEKATAEAKASGACDQMESIMQAFDTAHIDAFDKKDFSLFKVRVEQWGCFIFATLASEEEVPPVETYLGDVAKQLESYDLESLVSVREHKYDSKANWKLLAENFMEYYHLPSVHPALCNVSRVDDHHREQGASMAVSFVTRPLTNGGTPIDPAVLPSFPGLAEDCKLTGVFHQLFPNIFYFLLPSHIFVVRLDPTSPTTTIEHANLLVHPSVIEDAAVKEETDILNAKIDAMFDFYDMTNREDIDICEMVQEGVKNKSYRGGRVSFRFEETIHRFQNMLIDHMVGYPGRIPKGDKDIPFYIGGQCPAEAKNSIVNLENNL
ncbi:Choline monooxygenase, chloroplastic [Hondaea fermentalgiana]|uniref:Choline monooxygenase, chloroplastic n=1 Tax=Hondaea fermentalgiana TaxID=2315210 RepID=A0A2R5GR30_9STRA|nr:Choline monooxygenase, chloroplastic [Hondaea fermentalgiana]|eukprot:GBG33310.1 Choline monooxygenase, chloroplastic [Hondaea fermentalgiana]